MGHTLPNLIFSRSLIICLNFQYKLNYFIQEAVAVTHLTMVVEVLTAVALLGTDQDGLVHTAQVVVAVTGQDTVKPITTHQRLI